MLNDRKNLSGTYLTINRINDLGRGRTFVAIWAKGKTALERVDIEMLGNMIPVFDLCRGRNAIPIISTNV